MKTISDNLSDRSLTQIFTDVDANFANALATFQTQVKQYNSSYNGIGFARVGDATPPDVAGNVYQAMESGTIFGIDNVEEGQWLVGSGSTGYSVEPLETSLTDHETRIAEAEISIADVVSKTESFDKHEGENESEIFYAMLDANDNVVFKIDKYGNVYGKNIPTEQQLSDLESTKALMDIISEEADDDFLNIIDSLGLKLIKIKSSGETEIPLLILSEKALAQVESLIDIKIEDRQTDLFNEVRRVEDYDDVYQKAYPNQLEQIIPFNIFLRTLQVKNLPDYFKIRMLSIGIGNSVLADVKAYNASGQVYNEVLSDGIVDEFVEKIYAKQDFVALGAERLYFLSSKYYFEMYEVEEAKDTVINNRFKGKNIVWVGTSIPAGSTGSAGAQDLPVSYPKITGRILGANVYNESVGESGCRIGGAYFDETGAYPSSFFTIAHQSLYNLSETVAEKEIHKAWINANGGSLVNDYSVFSYEKKLIAKYMNESDPDFIAKADYLVIDHGHNDWSSYGDTLAEFSEVPTIRNNRTSFIGSVNYVIEECRKYNPSLKVIIITHHITNQRINGVNQLTSSHYDYMEKGHDNLAAYHQAPICRLYDLTGYSLADIIYTDAWWEDHVDGGGQIFRESGYSGGFRYLSTYDVLQAGGVHPSNDVSNKVNNYLAGILAAWFKSI